MHFALTCKAPLGSRRIANDISFSFETRDRGNFFFIFQSRARQLFNDFQEENDVIRKKLKFLVKFQLLHKITVFLTLFFRVLSLPRIHCNCFLIFDEIPSGYLGNLFFGFLQSSPVARRDLEVKPCPGRVRRRGSGGQSHCRKAKSSPKRPFPERA